MADLKFLRGSSESWATVKLTADVNTFYIVEYPAQPSEDGQAEKYELYLGDKLIGDGTSLEMIDGMLAEYAKKTDLDAYVKTVTADSTYAKKTDLDSYVTTKTAESTYAKKSEISDMLTKTEASSTYATKVELGATNAGAGLETNGSYKAPEGSNYLSGATTLKGADTLLDAAIKVVSDKVDGIIAEEVNVEAGAGISVDADETGHTATISVNLNDNDKVLTADEQGLLANINLTWSSSDGLKLIGKKGTEIATIAASEFIKDGMLEDVELVVLSEGTETNPKNLPDGTYLKFTFNAAAESKVIYVNVTSLIDVYTGTNGVQVSGKEISAVKDTSSEAFLEISAAGIKVSGIQSAINSAKDEAVSTVKGDVETLDTLGKVEDKITAIDAYTVNSKAINSNPTLNGADIKLDGYVQATGTAAELNVAAKDTVNVAIGKLEKAIVDKEAVTSEALNSVKTSVGLGDSFDYVAPSGTYVNGATSVKDADEKLDAAIKGVSDKVTEIDSAYKAADTALGQRIDELGGRTIEAKDGSNVSVESSGTTTTIGLVWGTF